MTFADWVCKLEGKDPSRHLPAYNIPRYFYPYFIEDTLAGNYTSVIDCFDWRSAWTPKGTGNPLYWQDRYRGYVGLNTQDIEYLTWLKEQPGGQQV